MNEEKGRRGMMRSLYVDCDWLCSLRDTANTGLTSMADALFSVIEINGCLI